MTPKSPSEHAEQVALFQFAKLSEQTDDRWELLNSSQNGLSASSLRAAIAAKAAGMKKGFPDLTFPVPISPFHGLYIELKRKNGVLSDVKPEQKVWLARLKDQGYYAEVAFGWEDARDQIQNYLLGHKKAASKEAASPVLVTTTNRTKTLRSTLIPESTK